MQTALAYYRTIKVWVSEVLICGRTTYSEIHKVISPDWHERKLDFSFLPLLELSNKWGLLLKHAREWTMLDRILHNSFIRDSNNLVIHSGQVESSCLIILNRVHKKVICYHPVTKILLWRGKIWFLKYFVDNLDTTVSVFGGNLTIVHNPAVSTSTFFVQAFAGQVWQNALCFSQI